MLLTPESVVYAPSGEVSADEGKVSEVISDSTDCSATIEIIGHS